MKIDKKISLFSNASKIDQSSKYRKPLDPDLANDLYFRLKSRFALQTNAKHEKMLSEWSYLFH